MPDIPDNVIEKATRAAFMAQDAQEQFVHGFAPDDFVPVRWQSGEMMNPEEAGVKATAPVIAGWAARQERVRIREAIGGPEALGAAHEVGLRLANSDGPKEVPAGDYLGGSAMVAGILLAGLDTALAALDREGQSSESDAAGPSDLLVSLSREEIEDLLGACPVGWVRTDVLTKLHSALDREGGQ